MPVMRELRLGGVPVKVYTDDIDEASVEQLGAVSRLPIVRGHVAAMPDVHLGIGATVGAVIPTRAALIPAAVGVDIGCGMTAVRLSLTAADLPDDLKPTREAIENAVPLGRAGHARPAAADGVLAGLAPHIERTLDRHPGIRKRMRNIDETWRLQTGSLGSGNHFIEVTVEQDGDDNGIWIMLHSGSRGIGNAVGRYFTELARTEMARLDRRMPEGRDLAYLEEGTEHFADYVDAIGWAQHYALENRRTLLQLTLGACARTLPRFKVIDEVVECHHNYVALERHAGEAVYVTRKGAIRARQGDRGIIPGSMGTRSYIVRGLGAADAFHSCAHGAGRRMSRSAAKRAFSIEDLEAQTSGVECRKDAHVLDEIPGAYKDIDQVMANASDLVTIEHTLRQVVCVKG